MRTRKIALTQEAQEQLVSLQAALDSIGLSIDQAHALVIAGQVAEDALQNSDDDLDDYECVSSVLESWAEDGRDAWNDVLCEVAPFLLED